MPRSANIKPTQASSKISAKKSVGGLFITLAEATKHCTYSQEYLSLLARGGELKAQKIGRNWYTQISWLKDYIENHPSDLKGNFKGQLLMDIQIGQVVAGAKKEGEMLLKNKRLIKKPSQKVLLNSVPAALEIINKFLKKNLPTFFRWQKLSSLQLMEKSLVGATLGLLLVGNFFVHAFTTQAVNATEKINYFYQTNLKQTPGYALDFFVQEFRLADQGVKIAKKIFVDEWFAPTTREIVLSGQDLYQAYQTPGVSVKQPERIINKKQVAGLNDQKPSKIILKQLASLKNLSFNLSRSLAGEEQKLEIKNLSQKIYHDLALFSTHGFSNLKKTFL